MTVINLRSRRHEQEMDALQAELDAVNTKLAAVQSKARFPFTTITDTLAKAALRSSPVAKLIKDLEAGMRALRSTQVALRRELAEVKQAVAGIRPQLAKIESGSLPDAHPSRSANDLHKTLH